MFMTWSERQLLFVLQSYMCLLSDTIRSDWHKTEIAHYECKSVACCHAVSDLSGWFQYNSLTSELCIDPDTRCFRQKQISPRNVKRVSNIWRRRSILVPAIATESDLPLEAVLCKLVSPKPSVHIYIISDTPLLYLM